MSSIDAKTPKAKGTTDVTYPFVGELTRTMRSGRSRSIVLSGSVQDLFYAKDKYMPLVPFLLEKFNFSGKVQIGESMVDLAVLVLDLNDGVHFVHDCESKIVNMFVAWQLNLKNVEHLPSEKPLTVTRRTTGGTPPKQNGDILESRRQKIRHALYHSLTESRNNNVTGLQILRRFVEASQATNGPKLLIIVEGADLVVPTGDVANLPASTIRKMGILESWFSDPVFMDGQSTVLLLSESYATIHPRVTRLPQVINIDIPAPDHAARSRFIDHFYSTAAKEPKTAVDKLGKDTAGLSLHAVRQLLVEHVNADRNVEISPKSVIRQVSDFIRSRLGESVKFYRPEHDFTKVRGSRNLKKYAKEDMIPRLLSSGDGQLSAVVAAGPIGAGKSFFFDAVAHEMDCPVLELGNIRSSLYGGTDAIINALERVLADLPRVLIMLPEADTVLGGLGKEVHETEKRLTGRFQAMMSDPRLRRRVGWVLDTARVDRLSPDIRRPGRADVIIPFLDPDDKDREEFVSMLLEPFLSWDTDPSIIGKMMGATKGFSAAVFGAIRSRAAASAERGLLKTVDDLLWIIDDTLVPDIGDTRRYQTLQALLNCTSRSLWPAEFQVGSAEEWRKSWRDELGKLSAST